MKKKGFIQNTFIMFAAMFITKGLGAVLKIPLGNILGGEGMGYFTTAYSIFTPVLAFTCSGIPMIMTQTAARYSALNKRRELFLFRRSVLLLGAAVGLAGTLVIYIAAFPFAYYIANSPGSLPSILLIAPAVFGCSVTAVYRGYYEGLSDMLPTAVSQVIEASVKAAAGIGLSYYVYTEGTKYLGSAEKALPYAAAAAILGVTLSEFCGTFYIVRKIRKDTAAQSREYGRIKLSEAFVIMKDVFFRSLPAALGAAASNLVSFTDMLTVSNCINISRSLFPEAFEAGLSHILSGAPSDLGNFMYGSYSGMVLSVYMLISAAAAVVARCSLPKLVCAFETNDTARITSCLKMMLKGTAFICVPVSIMMTVMARPVLTLLYPVRTAEVSVSVLPLQILCLGGIPAGIGGALITVFTAFGDFKTPVRITLYGGAVKLLLNAVLLTVPQLNISGAALATVISGGFCAFLSARELKKRRSLDIRVIPAVGSPLLAGAVSGLCLYFTYNAAAGKLNSLLCVLFPLALSAFVYIFILFISDAGELQEIIRGLRKKDAERACK